MYFAALSVSNFSIDPGLHRFGHECGTKISKETRIYSVLSFPRRRESSQIKRLDPRLRGDDELICVSLGVTICSPAINEESGSPALSGATAQG